MTNTIVTQDVSSLKSNSNFNGDIVSPGDPDYQASLTRWAVNAQRPAQAVIFPKDNETVAATIKWAVANNISLAVKGGGHAASGASSIDNGIVIDLSRHMNTVKIDLELKQARIGGGALWADVDKAAIEHGLATPGGTVNHTGVGGLTLGGGYGFLTGEHGLVVDNLIEATIVTASGSILKANEKENTDLFWGIRGGGGNFGVATEFILRLHPQRKTVFGGVMIFPGTMAKTLFDILADLWAKKFSPKQCAVGLMASPPPHGQPVVGVILFYNGTEEEGQKVWKPILDLDAIINTCGEMPFELMNTLQNPNVPPGRNVYMAGSSYMSNEPGVVLDLCEKVVELNNANPEIDFLALTEYIPLETINKVAPDATAFPMRGQQSGVGFAALWDNVTEANHQKAQAGVAAMKQVVVSHQNFAHIPSAHTGYANFECVVNAPPSKSKIVFKNNYERLRKIKTMYDPNMVFSRWFGIEPEKAGE